jgi:hypothetical protein
MLEIKYGRGVIEELFLCRLAIWAFANIEAWAKPAFAYIVAVGPTVGRLAGFY